MTALTEDGQRIVAEVAARHGVSAEAATHMLLAVAAGQGTQAQFNHPELGGMGQWSLGGMTMVGDMFNNALKARVDSLGTELSGLVRQPGVLVGASQTQSQSHGSPGVSLFVQSSGGWPADLGQPASVGAQNDMRYAWFPDRRRLAIDVGGRTTVYDTGDHRIGGFGQAQSGGQSLTFTSQHGVVRVADLPVVGDGAQPQAPQDSAEPPASAPAPAETGDDQVFARIEKLADLFQRGILSEAEFEAKKAELLARL